MASVPVAAECEWGDIDHILEDFQKLLLARVAVRVFIYDESKLENARTQFCHWIKQVL